MGKEGEVGKVTTLKDGRKTVTTAGTREALVATSTPAKYCMLQAETDNTGIIAWGGSTVVATVLTRRGQALLAGDSSPWIPVDDLIDIYLDTTVNGDGVTYIYLT